MQADDNPSVRAPRLPEGQRIYAVGPVQGQIGLLRRLLLQIYGDSRIRKPASTSIVFLGDVTGPEPLSIDLIIALSRISNERCVVLRCLEDNIFCASLIGNSTRWKSGETEADMEAQSRLHDQTNGEATLSYDDPQPNIDAVNYVEKALLSWSTGDYIFLPRDARMPDGNVITGDHFPIKYLPGDDPLLIHARPSRAQLSVRRQFSLGSERIAISNAAGQYGNLVALAIDSDEMLLLRTSSESNALVDINSVSDSGSPLEAAHNSIDEIDRLIRAIIGSPAPGFLENRVKPEKAPQATRTRSEDISNPTPQIDRSSTRIRSIVLVLLIPLSAAVLMRPSVPDHVHRDLHSLPIKAIALPVKRIDSVILPRAPLPPLLASATQDRTAERDQPEGHTKIKRSSQRPTAVLWSKHSQSERHSPYLQRRPLITSQGTGQAVHLTGKALEIALAADRLATRNLNNIELDNIRSTSRCRRTRRRGQNACIRNSL